MSSDSQSTFPASNLVSGLTKLGNAEGESWVTLREAEAAAVCAELSKLHAEHLQDVERMDRAATAMEAYQAEIARLTAVETGCDAAPVAVSDLLAECARRYAGDVALSRPHPLWGAIEAYEAARAGCVCGEPNTPGVQHRTDGPCFVLETSREPAPSAMQALTVALQADPDYAWSWHCNLAMPIMDSLKCLHEAANEAGADLMQHLFQIDIRQHPHWQYERSQVKSTAPLTISKPPQIVTECPKCRTQLAFEGDECGLCKEEA